MNKTELVAALARRTGLPRARCREILGYIFDVKHPENIIVAQLVEGDPVTLPGFGSFRLRILRARQTTHPTTKQPVHLPPRLRVVFRTSRRLNERIGWS